ncbi:MAG: Acylphosphatase [Candidatus Nomurabacteria bacterium GW2011_GWA1_35_8]|uniref:acylphosphatase n=1 Tax=Candidatus Nomurabacteria bacterium GW2011_GWA1_35_8 TaxID=1618727 RepID=A0A0G0CXF1_9BACT|nr:MAG: Acylphosphatase [Candidatus Nomurabacteria bacterium GW2011_GWA1_35_8]
MQKQVILKIYGKVQGVFFRDSSWRKAKELNLFGWVRNESDKTVQVVAEGQEEDLKELIEWCKNDPGHSKVDKVDIKWFNPTNQFNDFLIK